MFGDPRNSATAQDSPHPDVAFPLTYSTHLELDISIQFFNSRDLPEGRVDLEVASGVLSVGRRVLKSLMESPANRLHRRIGSGDLAKDLERLWSRVEEVGVEVGEAKGGVVGRVVGDEGCGERRVSVTRSVRRGKEAYERRSLRSEVGGKRLPSRDLGDVPQGRE